MADSVEGEAARDPAAALPEPGATAAGPSPASSPQAGGAHQSSGSRKLGPGDLVLGAPALASEVVSTWLEQKAPTEEQALAQQASRPVLLPESEWVAVYGPLNQSRARYATIGLAVNTSSRLRHMGGSLIQAGDETVIWVLGPFRRSRMLAPLRRAFRRLVDAGDAQVDQWAAVGRARAARSQALTQATLRQLVTDSTDLVADEPHVQLIVEQIVTSQGLGMAEEALLEVRERAVTVDIALEKPVRSWFHLPPRNALPGPEPKIVVPVNPRDRARHPDAPDLAGEYAGFASRLMAFVFDMLVILTAYSLSGMLFTAMRTIFHIDALLGSIFGNTTVTDWQPVAAGAIAILLAVVYWIGGWALTGQSLGDMIMGVRVAGRGGRYPSLARSCLRAIGYFLCILTFGIGFLWILIDGRRQGWHDKLAGTVVLYNWHARPDETFLVGPADRSP
jgi:uncharacterized RDD family membrane protein YckC